MADKNFNFFRNVHCFFDTFRDAGAMGVGAGEEGLEDTEVELYLNQVRLSGFCCIKSSH